MSANAFREAIQRHGVVTRARLQTTIRIAVRLLYISVVEGSALTGSPGQPVDTGRLRDSFVIKTLFDNRWQVLTDVPYAYVIEDNLRDFVFKNHGPHSIKKSIAGWQAIINEAARQAIALG